MSKHMSKGRKVKFLIDKSKSSIDLKIGRYPDLVAGQLLTPLTRYRNAGVPFAIDNGAFSCFDSASFRSLLQREDCNKNSCLFVVVPDIVGSARRTLEIWKHRHKILRDWPMAFVAQDGQEDLDIPWDEMDAIFIGGRDPWKDSRASLDIVKTAKTLGVHVHVGRVNTARRFRLFADAGADTCDGSGVAMYDHMLEDISLEMENAPSPTLFDSQEEHIECEDCE